MDRAGAKSDRRAPIGSPAGDPLALSPAKMRELGYRTIDAIVDQLTDAATPAMRHALAQAPLVIRGGTDRPAHSTGREASLAPAAAG